VLLVQLVTPKALAFGVPAVQDPEIDPGLRSLLQVLGVTSGEAKRAVHRAKGAAGLRRFHPYQGCVFK